MKPLKLRTFGFPSEVRQCNLPITIQLARYYHCTGTGKLRHGNQMFSIKKTSEKSYFLAFYWQIESQGLQNLFHSNQCSEFPRVSVAQLTLQLCGNSTCCWLVYYGSSYTSQRFLNRWMVHRHFFFWNFLKVEII